MLAGKPAVFLSCSERFKEQVAIPVRDFLDARGMHGVIVSGEPLPSGASWEPDGKVESYLDASDAFVGLCTPDDQMADGSVQCRQNIIDEIQRARGKPHIRSKIYILKCREVRLPSNINPTYDHLDVDRVQDSFPALLRQLTEWGVVHQGPARPVSLSETPSIPPVDDWLAGLELGGHEEAERRAYLLLASMAKHQQRRFAAALADRMAALSDERDNGPLLIAASLLEAINRLDPRLVTYEIIEKLTLSRHFSARSSSAILLWDKVKCSPGEVPIDLLGRLARPSSEDWYVYSPAMAATKLLALSRQEAYVIFGGLANSSRVEDRAAAASALASIAAVDPVAVSRKLAISLADDQDEDVSRSAKQALSLIENISDAEFENRWFPFGM